MKKLFLFVAIPIVAILGAILALVLLVNPNQFKPMIVEQAKLQTGLDLAIEGDIGWKFFPSIGFELGQTELRNPEGFSQLNMLKVNSAMIEVSVTPLFSKQLEIGNIVLDGAQVSIETLKDGRKNIDALTKAQSTQAEQPQAQQETAPANSEPKADDSSPAAEWTIHLAGVSISNAAVDVQDLQAGSFTKLYDVNLSLSEFEFNRWVSADFGAKGELNQQKFATQGHAEFNLAKGFAEFALRNIELDSSFSDPSTQMDNIKLSLDTFEFDKANQLSYALKGKAAELAIDMKGSASLTVDKAISKLEMSALTLDANLEGDSLPQSPMKVDMASDLTFDLTKSHLSFVLQSLTANALAFDGKADITLADIPKVRFSLHSPNIDLDEFLGLKQASAKPAESDQTAPQESSKPASVEKEVEPDLSTLKTLDVQGKITIDKFKANNAHMQEVKASFLINRGIAELTSFSSKLYQGTISATAKLDGRKSPASYTVQKRIKNVHVQPLLKDVADNDQLEGTGNINVDLKGKSLTPTGIQSNLVGTVAINFADGAVNGINVAKLIRENYARFKGQKLEEEDSVQKTDFSAMTATLKLNKGNVSTNDLSMQSPLLRIRGKGDANYIKQTVDFTISTSIVGSLEGQGGKDIDDLRDITIPINISGEWSKPKYKLVFDDVLKQKAEKEIDRGVEKLTDKIKDEETKEAVNSLIKGLFN
ncbi:AsmA family protein [Vibrio sinaloensis]|uniref:AsmA family protein n=1 Tax=Photobacterium sp. (strain ATCC 43367) TaxID=379097 RepID=UPI0035EB7C4A